MTKKIMLGDLIDARRRLGVLHSELVAKAQLDQLVTHIGMFGTHDLRLFAWFLQNGEERKVVGCIDRFAAGAVQRQRFVARGALPTDGAIAHFVANAPLGVAKRLRASP